MNGLYNGLLDGSFNGLCTDSLGKLNKNNPLNNGLVAYWSLQDGVGTKAIDISGNGFNGLLTNFSFSGTSNWITAPLGYGLSFDGVDDFINCGNTINVTTAFSLGFWFKRASGTFAHAGKYLTAGGVPAGAFLLQIYSDNVAYLIVPDSLGALAYITFSVPSTTDNKWNYLVGTWISGVGKLYLNGLLQNTALVGTYPTSVNQNTNSFEIQRYKGSSSFTYGNSSMTEVRLYNRVLTPTEIQMLYNSPRIDWRIKNYL